jgi:predicted dehydrogenase
MRTDIYPKRYGKWDESIELFNSRDVPVGEFDLIFIGTPPASHLSLGLRALEERPKAILIEKPLCPPALELAQSIYLESKTSTTRIFVGYDHVVSKATREVEKLFKQGIIGEIITLDAEFREHWGGIFAAHPWLNGPGDSYLGYWERGGGASGEHSHATNLWQHFAHIVSAGRVIEVDAMLKYVVEGKVAYDRLCLLNLKTDRGLVGRVVQDVVTVPSRKQVKLAGTKGSIEWINGFGPEGDAVICRLSGMAEQVTLIPKKRPDDFIEELKHIQMRIEDKSLDSPICLDRGLDTMLVIAAAHVSEEQRCRVEIDHSKGYAVQAIRPIR